MLLKLMDFTYENFEEFDIGNLEDIAKITIEVITGDEVAHVIYKDYSTKSFDGCGMNDRLKDYHDGEYKIYDFEDNENLIDDPKWLNRKTSYDYI